VLTPRCVPFIIDAKHGIDAQSVAIHQGTDVPRSP